MPIAEMRIGAASAPFRAPHPGPLVSCYWKMEDGVSYHLPSPAQAIHSGVALRFPSHSKTLVCIRTAQLLHNTVAGPCNALGAPQAPTSAPTSGQTRTHNRPHGRDALPLPRHQLEPVKTLGEVGRSRVDKFDRTGRVGQRRQRNPFDQIARPFHGIEIAGCSD
jgi:hypothetical protein